METYWLQVCEDFSSNTVTYFSVTLGSVTRLEKTAGFTHLASSRANLLLQKKVFT